MHPALALHRSIIFWAGLLIAIFTCWAWWDSSRHYSGLRIKQVIVTNIARGISIYHDPKITGTFDTYRNPIPPYAIQWPGKYFPPPFLTLHQSPEDRDESIPPLSNLKTNTQLSANRSGPGFLALYLPHWLLLLIILTLWTLLLRARAHRIRRALQPSP